MNITVINARDLSEAWFLCLRKTLTEGYEYLIQRGSYCGQRRKELDYVTVRVEYPGTRPLVPDVPPGIPPPTSMDYIESYLPYLMTSHKKAGEQYTYGQYLESQIAEVIRIYRKDGPNTNQAFMSVGDAASLKLADPPCLRSIDTRVRYGKLHFMLYFRSWDLWAGFPSNLAAIQLLKEYMASEIGVADGEIIASSKGLHLYQYCWEQALGAARMEELRTGQLELFDTGGNGHNREAVSPED
ncbi:MAG: thymidylate synthase [Chloroflexota bacterium]